MIKALLSCVVLFATPMQAVTVDLNVCNRTEIMFNDLFSNGFQQTFVGSAGDYVFSTWANNKLGWVTLVSTQDGTSCVVASGNEFVVTPIGEPV